LIDGELKSSSSKRWRVNSKTKKEEKSMKRERDFFVVIRVMIDLCVR
jgi:hypothetical protein